MIWQAPTYHSEVTALLPAEKTRFEVDHPRRGRIEVFAIDWQMPDLELFDREFGDDLLTIVSPAAITPPSDDFVLRKRPLTVPPWNNNAVFWCDFCRVWRPAFLLQDVEGFPADLTDGRKWACDGCRTRWFREGKPADGAAITKRKWAQLMFDFKGAPQAFLDKMLARDDVDRTHYSI